jgi:hypothetical protein
MTTLIFKVAVTDIAPELTTRPTGAQARGRLIQALEDFEAIEVDFRGKSLTPSFADECIGRLAATIGLGEFKRRVKLTNLNESTKSLVKHVILTRCSPAGR